MFTAQATLPGAVTRAAAGHTTTTATLNGAANPNGSATTVWFEYGPSLGYGTRTPVANIGSGTNAIPLSETLTGLDPGASYHFRVVASNSFGVVQGGDMVFSLSAFAPSVTTLPAENIGVNRATLRALVSANGAPTQVRFEYGPTPGYGTSIVAVNNLEGPSASSVNHVVSGLLPATQIYWRAIASNDMGTATAIGATFRTLVAVTNAQPSPNTHIVTVGEIRPARAGGAIQQGELRFLIEDGGAGYTTPPAVTLGGPAAGAVVHAVLNDGAVANLVVVTSGTYASDERFTVDIAPPPNPIEMVLTNASNIDTIILSAGRFEMLTAITRDVTIKGQGTGLTILSGGRRGGVLRVQPGVNATLSELTITEGEAASGGGIYNDEGRVSLTGCDIVANYATGLHGEGGGLYNRGNAVMTLSYCSVRNNFSTRNGGGISSSGINTELPGVADARAVLDRVMGAFEDAAAFGVEMVHDFRGPHALITSIDNAIEKAVKGIANSVTPDSLADPGQLFEQAFAQNSAGGKNILGNNVHQVMMNNISSSITSMPNPFDPGASAARAASPANTWFDFGAPVLIIDHCSITGNRVEPVISGFGGGIHNDLGLVLIKDSLIVGNAVDSGLASFGGGVNSIFGALSVLDSTVSHNRVKSTTVLAQGAGIQSMAGILEVHRCTFEANAAQALFLSSGGAIKNTLLSRATVNESVLIRNSSGGGGAVANDFGAGLTMGYCTIASNSVAGIIGAYGGGIQNEKGGTLLVSNSLIFANSAEGRARGGGIYNHAETTLEVLEQGLLDQSEAVLINCTVSSNRVIGAEFQIPDPIRLAGCYIASFFGGVACDYNTVTKYTFHLEGRGGGLYNGSETEGVAHLELRNCTIVGNAAYGVRSSGSGLRNTVVAGINPVELGTFSGVRLSNTIMAHNNPGENCDNENGGGVGLIASVESRGFNLDSDGSVRANATGPVMVNANPGVGPLANNGGPTLTHGLLAGSPAIDAGNSDPQSPTDPDPDHCPSIDQRGVVRVGGRCDIGAFESAPPVATGDAYETVQGELLIVGVSNGVLVNDFAANASAQLATNVANGALQLNADGSFTYLGLSGTNIFWYVAMDGLNQVSPPVPVTIIVRPVMKIVSVSPPTNRLDAPRNGAVTITFDTPLDPASAAAGISFYGAHTVLPSIGVDVQNNTLTLVPSADWHGSESITVSVLQTLRGVNSAALARPATWQFRAGVTSAEGTFLPGQSLGDTRGRDVALGDLDGDGDIDMYIAREGGDQVWRNLGDGSFSLAQVLAGRTTGVALADLDQDGDLDAFLTRNDGERIPHHSGLKREDGYLRGATEIYGEFNRVLFNDGTGAFSDSGQRMSSEPSFGIDPVESSTQGGVIIGGPGQPYFLDLSTSSFYYRKIIFPGSEGVALGDLDGDGDVDAFVVNAVTRTAGGSWRTPGNTVWLNNGRGFFARTDQVLGSGNSERVALGDLDSDGDLDAFVANRSFYNAPNTIWLNDGRAHFSPGEQVGGADNRAVALGDLDNDGDLDALVAIWIEYFGNEPHSSSRVWLNDGAAQFTAGQIIGTSANADVALADFNDDGRLDACLAGVRSANVWMNTGNAQFAIAPPRLGSRFAEAVAAGDLDNDGDADLLVANASPFERHFSDEHRGEVWLFRRQPMARPNIYGMLEDGQLIVDAGAGLLSNDLNPQGASLNVETTTVVAHHGTLGQLIGRFGAQDFRFEGGSYVYHQVVPVFAANGLLNLRADGSFTYAPNTNFFGTDSFQYVVTDGVLSATSVVSIIVSALNDPPMATNDFHNLTPGNPLVVNAANGVLANDRDPEGNIMTASVAQVPAHGSLNLNSDGSFTYTPNGGTDAFTYYASDGQTQSLARVKLGNTAPVAVNDAYLSYTPGTVLTIPSGSGVLSNDSDPDGDPTLSAVVRLPAAHGTVVLGGDGSFTYTPRPGYSGADAFTYQASDGLAKSSPARVKIGNARPVAVPDSDYSVIAGFTLTVGAQQGVLVNDTDSDGEPLTAILVAGPASGQLTLNSNGSFIYLANSNFSGSVSFSYRADDDFANSDPTTVSISVNGVLNIIAVSPSHHTANVPTNSEVAITFSAPVQIASLTDRLVFHGSHGRAYPWTASANGNTVTLTFARPFLPGEAIQAIVNPGIRGVGPLELAYGMTWQFEVAAPRGSASFVENQVPSPFVANRFVALGDLDNNGVLDAFVVSGDFATGVTLLFNGSTQQVVGETGLRTRVVLGDLDRDGDVDALTIGGSTFERWLNNGAGTFTSTPHASPFFTEFIDLGDLDGDGDLDAFAVGSDLTSDEPRSFVWTWSNDGAGNFSMSAPVPTFWTGVDGALGDLNGDGALDVYLVGWQGDQVWFNDGAGEFTPGAQGLERRFNQAVRLGDLDGDGDLDVFVSPGEIVRGPRVLLNTGNGRFGIPLELAPARLGSGLALGDLDGDGDLDAIEAVIASSSGRDGTNSIWINNGSGSFVNHSLGFPGSDSQGVALGDLDGDGDLDAFFANGRSHGETNKIWINRTVPLARDDFYPPNGASPVVINAANGVLANDLAGDGGGLTARFQSNPSFGALSLNADGSFTYTPGGSFTGTDVFAYRASDSFQTSAIARVKIGNFAPIAQNDSGYVALNDTPLTVLAPGVLANDSDAQGDPLRAVLLNGPAHGTIQLKPNGAFTYAASAGYTGADSFTYQASDGYANSATATVTLDVRAQLALVEQFPRPNAIRVPINSNIVLRFNHLINPATVSTNLAVHGNAAVPLVVGDTVTLDFLSNLPAGGKLAVSIATGLEGTAGERLVRPIVFEFTVEAPLGNGVFVDSGQRLLAVPTSSNSVDVALGDMDRDGDLDAFVAQTVIGLGVFPNNTELPGSKADMVWRNNGTAVFSDTLQRLGTNRGTSIALGDIDGDSQLDAISANIGGSELWRNASGVFTPAAQSPAIPELPDSQTIRLGDLDGDGDLDLFMLHVLNISVWWNQGATQFTDSGQRMATVSPYVWVELGDLDNDGDLDAFLVPGFSDRKRVLFNNGSGVFSDSGAFGGESTSASRLALGDLDGDGDLDAYIARIGPDEIWLNDGRGFFTFSQALDNYATRDVNLADVDADGDLDAAIVQLQFGVQPPINRSKIWFNNGNGIFTDRGVSLGDALFNGFAIAVDDLDADGDLDVFLAGSSQASQVWLNGASLAPPQGTSALVMDDKSSVAPFSGIILRAPPTATVSLRVLFDSSKGAFTASDFTGPSGNAYTLSGRSVSQAQAALRQLVFVPTQNRQPVGSSETTTFTIEATDGIVSHTNNATTVAVISANDAPTAANNSGAGFATSESAAFITTSVLLNDTDPDPSESLSVTTLDLFGTIGIVTNRGDGTFFYSPNGRFNSLPLGASAADSFTYTIHDGHGGTASATVIISITGENSPPTAINDAITIGEHERDVVITPQLLANDSDIDADGIATLTVIRFGGASVPGNVVTYSPTFGNLPLGSSASDSFAYTITDAHGLTANATAFITVTGQNDVPSAQNDLAILPENSGLTNLTALLLANDLDADPGETLAITGVDTQLTRGLVTATNGAVTYDPNGAFDELPLGASATDTFDYIIADAHGASARATMTITIVGRNNPPAALADAIQISEHAAATNLTALLLVNDLDADTNEIASLAVTGITRGATNGLATFDANAITYVPNADLNLALGEFATDSFTYTIRDSHGGSASATATIFILGQNDSPIAVPDILVIDRDSPATNITALLLANDLDPNGGSLVINSVFTNGMRGLVTLSNGVVRYDPNGQFAHLNDGQSFLDNFVYTVRDSSGEEATAGATVIVAAGNFPPIISPISDKTVDEGRLLSFVITASDADPAGLRFSLGLGAPTNAAIDPVSGQFTWTPTEAQGPATTNIVVRVEDNGVPRRSSIASFIVQVHEINEPPVLAAVADQTARVGQLLRITNNVTDPDLPANRFSFALAPGAPAGARVLANGTLIWKPGTANALSSNPLGIVVTDNGNPPLSHSNSFRVSVGDYLQLSLGSTVLRAGQTGSVSIEIETVATVTNLELNLGTALDQLTNFSLQNVAPGLQSSIQPVAPDRLRLILSPGFPATGILARLQFEALANQTSAFVPLRMLDLIARPSTTTLAGDGRVAIIAGQSLLEALHSTNGQRPIVLYGIPGEPYRLQSTLSFTPSASWTTEWEGTLTNLWHVLDQPPANPTIFYRATQP